MTKYRTFTNDEFIPFLEQIEEQDELIKEAILRLHRFDEAVEETIKAREGNNYFSGYSVGAMEDFAFVLRSHEVKNAKELENILYR